MPCSLVGLGGCERVAIVDVNSLFSGVLTKRWGLLVTFNRRCERGAGVDVNKLLAPFMFDPQVLALYHFLQLLPDHRFALAHFDNKYYLQAY